MPLTTLRVSRCALFLLKHLGGQLCCAVVMSWSVLCWMRLGAVIEDFEVAWITKRSQPPMQLGEYLAALNTQRRLLVCLGLDRIARDVSDDFATEWNAALAEPDEATP
jgi:hypothetical protein